MEIRHLAAPLSIMPTIGADSVEDDSTGAAHAALRVRDQLERMRLLAAIELIVAAQAVDLAVGGRAADVPGRRAPPPPHRGRACTWVAVLEDDRPLGPDVERLAADAAGRRAAARSGCGAAVGAGMSAIELVYLGGADVDALALTDDEILDAVRGVVAAQGRGETVIEPRMHLFPRGANGHFNVLRGAVPAFAGVKVVGDYVDNHRLGLPSELALLLLMDPATGVPRAVIDATAITEMRTGAVTAIGAVSLARRDARVLGHVGARGTAYWNVRLLCRVLPSPRGGPRALAAPREPGGVRAAAHRGPADRPRSVRSTAGRSACAGADVMVEASRLTEPEPLLSTAWVTPGTLVDPLRDGERGGASSSPT